MPHNFAGGSQPKLMDARLSKMNYGKKRDPNGVSTSMGANTAPQD